MQLGISSAPRYRALRPVDERLGALFDEELRELPRGRLFDPECGPGRWLARFAARGWQVAGNERCPDLRRTTRARLQSACVELTGTDPRTLAFAHAPYDAAIEPSGALAEWDDGALVAHLKSAHAQLRPGGAYLCVLPIDDDPRTSIAGLCLHRAGQLSEGRSLAEHRALERLPGSRWRVRRSVRTRKADGSEHREAAEVVLHVRSVDAVLRLVGRARFEAAVVRCAGTGALLAPGEPFLGEALFALRVPDQSAGEAP